MGDGILSSILSYTSGACDARMSGAMIPVMSNSGSGNQGISATLPVVVYAEKSGAPEEKKIRALILSNLTVIYIKQSLGPGFRLFAGAWWPPRGRAVALPT